MYGRKLRVDRGLISEVKATTGYMILPWEDRHLPWNIKKEIWQLPVHWYPWAGSWKSWCCTFSHLLGSPQGKGRLFLGAVQWQVKEAMDLVHKAINQTKCDTKLDSFSVVHQPCLESQCTCCQELDGAADTAKIFLHSTQLAGGCLILSPWLVSVVAWGNSPGGCGGPSALLVCSHRLQSSWYNLLQVHLQATVASPQP